MKSFPYFFHRKIDRELNGSLNDLLDKIVLVDVLGNFKYNKDDGSFTYSLTSHRQYKFHEISTEYLFSDIFTKDLVSRFDLINVYASDPLEGHPQLMQAELMQAQVPHRNMYDLKTAEDYQRQRRALDHEHYMQRQQQLSGGLVRYATSGAMRASSGVLFPGSI